MARRRLSFFFVFLSAVLTITLFSKSSPLYPLNDWVDANCFLTTGKALLSGKVLYRDIYEQKGPLLYFLHALAAQISNSSFLGVWILESLCCTAYAWIGWKLVVRRCENPSVFFVPGLLFLTYTTVAFSSGDSAEEIALPFVAFAFASAMDTDWKRTLPSRRRALVIGISAGIVLWIKYTLCGLYIALALMLLAASVYQKKSREILPLAGSFLLGILLASLPVLIYFASHHAFPDLFSAYFINNIRYYSPSAGRRGRAERSGMLGVIARFALENPVFLFLILAGLLYALLKKHQEAVCLLCALFGALPFISLGANPYPYYAFLLAAFAIYGWVPVCHLAGRLIRFPWMRHTVCIVLSAVMGVYAFHASLNTYMLKTDQKDMPQYQFAQTILETEGATLLNYGFLDGGFYTAAGLSPSEKYFCKLNLPLEEMNRTLSSSVQEGRTTYVVTRGTKLKGNTPYELIDTARGLYQSNAEAPRMFTYYLYRLKEPDL